MTLDKRIAEHMKRVDALQKEVFDRKPSPADAKRPDQMKRERAATVRTAIDRLQRDRKQTMARFDAEITAREAELKELERSMDVDFAQQQSGSPGAPKPPGKRPTGKGKDSGR
jgi:septal ring factor EnvC (AmiA/AmiB activator)